MFSVWVFVLRFGLRGGLGMLCYGLIPFGDFLDATSEFGCGGFCLGVCFLWFFLCWLRCLISLFMLVLCFSVCGLMLFVLV